MPFFVEPRVSPVVVVAQHGGKNRVPGAAVRPRFAPADVGTWPLAEQCAQELGASFLAMNLHRSHVDTNRGPQRCPFADGFEEVYLGFYVTLHQVVAQTMKRFGHVFVLDVHGYGVSPGPEPYHAVLGTGNHSTCDESVSQRFREILSRRWVQTVFSPDDSLGISSSLSGGHLVHELARVWRSHGLSAIQIEFARHLRESDERSTTASVLASAVRELVY